MTLYMLGVITNRKPQYF